MAKDGKQKICIIGAGKIGQTVGKILKNRGHKILFWDKDITKVPGQKPLDRIVISADFVFFCIPSWTVRETMARIARDLNKDAIVILLAKGIEEKTNKTMDALLGEFLSRERIVILGGAMLAEELENDLGGVGVAGTRSKKIYNQLAELFRGTDLIIEHSSDMRGVAFAGVFKNIYAIALGIADGLHWGNNKKGALAAKAVGEMAEIIKIFGGQKETAYSAAGLGDLLATGYSPYSRNRRVGDELVKAGKCCLESEGSRALPGIAALLRRKKYNLPLFTALEDILVRNKNAKSILENFIQESRL